MNAVPDSNIVSLMDAYLRAQGRNSLQRDIRPDVLERFAQVKKQHLEAVLESMYSGKMPKIECIDFESGTVVVGLIDVVRNSLPMSMFGYVLMEGKYIGVPLGEARRVQAHWEYNKSL